MTTPNADLATRADLEQLRSATKADLEQLRLATKADIDRLELLIDSLVVGVIVTAIRV